MEREQPWSPPKVPMSGRPTIAEMLDYSAYSSQCWKKRLEHPAPQSRIFPFDYVGTVLLPTGTAAVTYAADLTGTISISLDADSDFVLTALSGWQEIALGGAAGSATTPGVVRGMLVTGLDARAFPATGARTDIVPPTDSAGLWAFQMRISSEFRSNAVLHSYAGIGSGRRPYVLPKPVFIFRSNTVTFDVTLRHASLNSSGEQNRIGIVMIGYKIKNRPPIPQTQRV